MDENPLKSLTAYSSLIGELLGQSTVAKSTVTVWSDSPYTGIAEGEVVFKNGLRLRMREEVDFEEGVIISYGYEVYREDERLFWYDDFPHPNDPTLASTMPHHKHLPPYIKHHRVPAPNISFLLPNLPALIQEIEEFSSQLSPPSDTNP